MKKVVLIGLVFYLITGCCADDEVSHIDGAWQLVNSKWSSGVTFPGEITGSGVKVWTKGSFAFAGEFQFDTITIDNYGWGKFTFIEGIKYEESILQHHTGPGLEGKSLKMLMELRNDTLIQSWPADDDWNLEEKHSIEKYVRLK